MKKQLFIGLLVAMATLAQAATIDWGMSNNGSWTDFGSDFLDDANAVVKIVYLGDDTVSTVSFDDIVNGSVEGSFNTDFGSIPYGQTIAVDTTHTGNFAAFIEYSVAGETYYNVSSGMGTLTAAAINALLSEGTMPADAVFEFSSTKNAPGATPTIGGGWYTTVPEPGIACMALLGLGMLVKRRRA